MRRGDNARRARVKIGARAIAVAFTPIVGLTLALGSESALASPAPRVVKVELYEWKVELEPATVRSGPVRFTIENHGSIPHAFEVEGHGFEKSAPQIAAGASGTLDATLAPGTFEVYCPIGNGSHKMLGMKTRLVVVAAGKGRAGAAKEHAGAYDEEHDMHAMHGDDDDAGLPKTMRVTGGGAVIHVLPGPFPFADSARAVIEQRPADQKADLEKKSHQGPYSNRVAAISGTISITATDRGATGDSVSGAAEFTTEDGAAWKLVLDRVQTKDIPFNPRFGGVIMGLYYHGASGVHTPLVPTIQSSLALWAYGHLDRNGTRVTDDAMVHVMLLSHTRRAPDWSLACWDCSRNPVDELQLQITPAPGGTPFDAPGGVLFVNWEQSSGERVATP
jgi:hypothetical protein